MLAEAGLGHLVVLDWREDFLEGSDDVFGGEVEKLYFAFDFLTVQLLLSLVEG